MKIENNKNIGESIYFQLSSRDLGNFNQDLNDTIIIHYTVGGSAKSVINTLSNLIIKEL